MTGDTTTRFVAWPRNITSDSVGHTQAISVLKLVCWPSLTAKSVSPILNTVLPLLCTRKVPILPSGISVNNVPTVLGFSGCLVAPGVDPREGVPLAVFLVGVADDEDDVTGWTGTIVGNNDGTWNKRRSLSGTIELDSI